MGHYPAYSSVHVGRTGNGQEGLYEGSDLSEFMRTHSWWRNNRGAGGGSSGMWVNNWVPGAFLPFQGQAEGVFWTSVCRPTLPPEFR
jgi:hypothetical protein